MFYGDELRTLSRTGTINPWTSGVTHARRLHPCNRFVSFRRNVDVVVGRGNADGSANILLMIHRERIGDHAAKTEPGCEHARRIDTQVLLYESQDIIEQVNSSRPIRRIADFEAPVPCRHAIKATLQKLNRERPELGDSRHY